MSELYLFLAGLVLFITYSVILTFVAIMWKERFNNE